MFDNVRKNLRGGRRYGAALCVVAIVFGGSELALATTYYAKISNGVNVATGITTDHGSCLTDPGTSFVEELSTNLSDLCTTAYRFRDSTLGPISEHYYNTAYAAATTVAGVSFQVTIKEIATIGVQLFYVMPDGSKTFLGTEATQDNPSGLDTNYIIDLSGQSGLAPAGSKLGLRAQLLSAPGEMRFIIGNPDGETGNPSGILNVTETSASSADLQITKTVDDSTPTEGDTIVYTAVLDNNGPDPTTNVAVTDLLPSGVTYVSDTTTKGTYASGTGIWTVGSMANGAAETLTITATVDPGTATTTIVNTASVSATDENDPTPGNDSDTANITVQTADLTLTKTDGPDPAPTDGPLVYTLLVTNNGPHAATGVTVTDTLPAGVTFQSATPSQGSCSGTTTVNCDLGAILNSGTASVEILVVTSSAGTITNNASVTANELDPVPADNAASEDTDVVASGTSDIPLTQFRRIHGFVDSTVTGGTLRTQSNAVDPCAVGPNSSANLSGIPATATVVGAYLYWSGSGSTVDGSVTFDGTGVAADRTFQAVFTLGATSYDFFGGFEDVTSQVNTKRNGSYSFADLTVDSADPYCASKAVIAGWSLLVIYDDNSVSGKTIVLYDGFDLERNGSTSYLLTSIYAADPPEAKTVSLLWEGDPDLGGANERLEFNGVAQSDGLNPADNVYNSTINSLGSSTSYGLDLDSFDVTGQMTAGDTLATTAVFTGPDLVVLNAVMLQVKSNIITGSVFEDVNYGGGAGRDLATASAAAPSFSVGRPGATVELYDSLGTFIRTTTTDPNGQYGFAGLINGDYTVRVVNDTVTSSRPGATGSEWSVQTYRTNAATGTAVAITNEVGGADPAAQDDPANSGSDNLSALTAQSLSPARIITGIAVTDVDFGYNYDTIVNTNDTGQGSLRRFIDNANALSNAGLAQVGQTAGKEVSIFMIADGAAHPGLSAGLTNLLSGAGVAVLSPATALSPITDADTVVDGTTQTNNVGNTNSLTFGTGGTVGVDALALSQVAGPEVEIRAGAAIPIGLQLQANNNTIRGLAILGFGSGGNDAGIVIDDTFVGALIENNVVGSTASSFTDPGAALQNYCGVETVGADSGTIQNNLIGFGFNGGICIDNGSTGWTVQNNELRDNGTDPSGGDGLFVDSSSGNTVSGNLIAGSGTQGIVLTGSGPNTFQNNTVTGNGVGLLGSGVVQSTAITIRPGTTGTVFDRNIVRANYGAGIQVNDGSSDTLLTRNSFADNGTIIARDGSPATGQIGIDLNAAGDDGNFGTAPFFTINDSGDGDSGGNGLLNYPVLVNGLISGGNVSLAGWARPGSVIEFFITDGDPSGFGEGETYLVTLTEGSGADTDATSSTYGPGTINGLSQGTDTTNRFSFTIPTPAGVVIGTELTATATIGNTTSEFSGRVATAAAISLSGRVFEDTDFAGTASTYDGGATDIPLANVDVELYDADNSDAYVSSTVTDASGVYTFASVANGNYKVRARSATIGDSNTAPAGGFNAACGVTDPASGPPCVLAEQTWANGSAVYGGQSPTVDDTATDNDAGPGDTWTSVSIAGAIVANVDFGFAYNLIVNTLDDGDASSSPSTQGSLRNFIKNANAIGSAAGTTANVSQFLIPGAGPHRIQPLSELPSLSDASTTIDGYTQPGAQANTVASPGLSNAVLAIELNGDLAGGARGLRSLASGSVIRGLVINGGFGIAVALDTPGGATVAGNYMGTNVSGTAASAPVPGTGLYVSGVSQGNTIGGASAGDRNLLSGTTSNTIWMLGTATANNTVRGNYIGTDVTGTSALANPSNAIVFTDGAHDNSVHDNVISGNATGVWLEGSISPPTLNTITGNRIGTNAAGSAAVPNNRGVYVLAGATNNTIGGTGGTDANIVSGNTTDGIWITGTGTSGTTVYGNFIGTDSSGTADLGNGSSGVRIDNSAVGNLIGGTAAGADNVIAYNAGDGVYLNGAGTDNNRISGNSIYENTGLGIDLDPDGVGTGTGSNQNKTAPTIDSTAPSGPNFVLTATVDAGDTVELFRVNNSAAPLVTADPSGSGEGFLFLGSCVDGGACSGPHLTDGLDAAGAGSIQVTLEASGLSIGDNVSATATDALGNTSEFSTNFTVSNDTDLVTTKVLDPGTPGPFAEGDPVSYLITVINNGPLTATNVAVTDAYPGELTLGTPAPSVPTTYAAGTGIWTIGTLGVGASATLTLPGTVNAGTAGDTVTNTVNAANRDQTDVTTTGDDLSEVFTVLPQLNIDDIAQAETDPVPGTTTFTFTVSINQAVGADVTFDIDTADNTATVADSDYAAISGGNGTILASATTTTIDVTVNGDAAIEADESFFVNLSNVVGAAVADGQGEGTINNDDAATISIAATTDGDEAGPVDGQFTITQSATSASDTVITYTVAGSATATTDYTALTGSVTVPNGSTTATIDVTGIVADALVEGSETVVVTLTGTDNPGITVAASPADNATVNIADNSSAEVSVAATTDGDEAGPVNGQFTVTQTATSASDTVITYTVAGSATATTDYTTLTGSVTVPNGSTAATIDVTGIVADALVEGTETVIVTLTGTDNVAIAVAANPADTATVNIADNNSAEVSVAATTDADEAGPVNGQFTVTQTATSASITVITYTIAGSATATTDYTALTGSVTIPNGSTTATIDVTGIVADALVEGTETVIVTLASTDNPGITVAASPADSAAVNINDNNSAEVSIAATTDADEAGPVSGQFTVTQGATSASDTVITYTVAGTAAGGTDYTALSGSVTVSNGSTAATIDVTGIVADALVEGTETVIVTLAGTDNVAITVAASPADTATVNIADNNNAEVSISATADGSEAGPVNGQFTISQTATSASDTVISYTVAGMAAAGTDYLALSGSVTVPNGATTATIDVTGIVADGLVEGSETVIVTLTGTDNVGIPVAGNPADTATINITDNDSANVSIAATSDGEEAGPVDGTFTVTQSATSVNDTVVSYTIAGTATSGSDFTALTGTVTVPGGSTTATITVAVIDDTLVEGVAETVVVTLNSITAGDPGVSIDGAANSDTVSITDNDTATLSVVATTQAADETGPVNGVFTVTQSLASVNDTDVTYTVAGTATAGNDYTALSGTVTIVGGSTFATIIVAVIDDAVVEGVVETVDLTLSSITASDPGVSIDAGANNDTVNITDNDAATVSIVASADGDETGPVDGQFTVSQTSTSVNDTVISYTVAGTATSGSDYTALSGTVTIPGGSTNAVITVPVIDDALLEGVVETVLVTLTAITASDPGVTIDGAADNATVNITDNDTATLNIVTTADGNEAGPVDGVFTVTQSTSSVNDTVVSYTVGGTATSGSDYTALSGTVTIAGGSTNAIITVPVVDDGLLEGVVETVLVTLTAITASDPGVTIDGAADNATANITDNDTATLSIATTNHGNETGPVDGTFTVTQSATSVNDTVMSYAVGGTATSGSDFTALGGSVTIPGGATTAVITVPVIDDGLFEGVNETVLVTLTAITASDPGVTIDAAADVATLNITDNDTAAVSIAATTDGNEAGPVDGVFTLTQSATSLNDTVLSYTVGGTATSGSDYTALSGSVTIPGGTTTATIVVPVIDDAVAEGSAESVAITLASITASDPGVNIAPSPDDSATITIVDNDADLITTKVVDNPTPLEGTTITYTLTVTNNAGVQATNVSLTDLLPPGVTYSGDDSGGAYDSASGAWNIGAIGAAAPANVAALNITATVDAGAASLAQPIANTTTAAIGDQTDPDTTTDTLTANITVDGTADLVTTKVVDNPAPLENSTIVFTLSVLNNGAARATNVSLTDLLPAGLTYVADDVGGAYNAITGVWNIGTIDTGTTETLNVTVSVDGGAALLTQPITNVTTAALGDQPDPDTTTDDLSEDVTINNNADLVTTKSVDTVSPAPGDGIVYTLTVTNAGPAAATNVTLTDQLPAGVSYVSDDGAGAYDSATGVWALGNLANGANAALNISATVDPGAESLPQPITNTATAAAGDQPDPDTTTDDLAEDINITIVDPNLIQLTKTVGRQKAAPGEIVAYSIELRNTSPNPVNALRVFDTPARGLKYIPGTAQLDGAAATDPAIGLPLVFDLARLPGLIDNNGNGTADPGEPGYAVLSYRMVAGSGVAPGIWTNTAIATVICDTCFVSNAATADIEIIEDTLFDLGTIIGKVFYDANGDGWQDSGEAGIAAAMVALDDGTYALTDEFGRYHFPAVKPGQRLLKINLASLAGHAVATTDKTRIVSVTPGLLAKANFGVIIDTVDAAIGDSGVLGIAIDSETIRPPVLINGSTIVPSLLVNGQSVSLATADVRLGTTALEDVVEVSGGKLKKPLRFSMQTDAGLVVDNWNLVVSGSRSEATYVREGQGNPPAVIEWDGVADNGKLVSAGDIYTYQMTLTTIDGQILSSGRRLFGVNRKNSVSLNLAGGAFVTGSHELTQKAKALLAETAKAIRAYPDEIITISGHTDATGTETRNMVLAERRARAAYDHLRNVERIPAERFVIQSYGESRPIAGNDTAWGRELNRRVEINGELSSVDLARNFDPHRQDPVVRINDTELDVDARGRFRSELSVGDSAESIQIALGTSQGRSVQTVVPLPTLQILSPHGQFAVPAGVTGAEYIDLDAVSDEGMAITTQLEARTEPGNTVELDGKPLDVDARGRFSAPIELVAGENYYGLIARNPMGMLRIANLKISVHDGRADEPVMFAAPIPQLALQLPPPGVPLTNSRLVVPGSTAAGNRVFINDQEVIVDRDGNFLATVELELGDNPFTATVIDREGYIGKMEQSFAYSGDPMFFMALVDGTFSQLQTSGSLAAAGTDKSEEFVSEGRVAYYLKGHVFGKYLLTSAFDSGQQELGDIFSDLTEQDNDRLLTNLDPDTLYPVYGDSSTLVYDAQSQSKFYLALESDTVTALIGNYALNFTDTELAAYQRTLYGATATYQSPADDETGERKTKAQAFYANIEQAHVRDEMRATGGSLYYLSQREVIEGSEHVSVIVRDQDSGLILERRALLQGLDYSIDYVDGRLLTNRPISSFRADSSLIDSNLLGGNAVYLQIDYETAVDGFEQTASGGRVRQVIGDRLAVGVTAVNEDQLGGEYSLQAADVEYRLGRNSRLIGELATSEGNNSVAFVSEDGGLTYQAVAQAAGSSGDAFKIAAEIDAGEWFGWDERLLLNTYFKRLDTGFSANSVTSEQGSEKSGIAATWKITDASSLLGRYERQIQLIDGSENALGTLQWSLVRNRWGVTAELEDRTGFTGDATTAAGRMSYRWTDTVSTYLEHQQTLAGLANDQSTVGVGYRATDKLTLDASATHGTLGDSAQLGAQLQWRGNRFYVAQQFNDLAINGISNNRLVGAEAPFGPDGAVYSEYHWNDLSQGQQQQQTMIGARQRYRPRDGLQIQVSGEHSVEDATNNNSGERYAVSADVRYDNDNGIAMSTRNEYRKDSRSIASEQFLSTSHLEMALGNDLAVLGKYRFSKSESNAQIQRDIDFTEASIGLAYRPVEHDRLNLLTRYTRLSNTPTEFQLADVVGGQTSDIFAIDWSYQLTQRIEWVGKQAMRWSENNDDPSGLRSQTSLTIQRVNWGLPKKFLLGTEYRLLSQDLANDKRNGFVTEIMWEGLDPLRLGAGYNFSDVSDNEFVDYNFSTKGLFMRVQGKF